MSNPQSVFDISTEEFETRYHVFDLWRWINAQLEQIDAREDGDTIYFERRGKNVKKLIEEAVPIAYLGLHLSGEAREVFIQCLAGNQQYDALCEIKRLGFNGWESAHFKIEVTVTEDNDSALRRQALSQEGFVFLTGPIRKEKGVVISEPEMVDSYEEDQTLRDLAYRRFLEKAASGKYDKDTAILVYVNSSRPLPLTCRAELVQMTHDYLLTNHPEIYGVFYCYRETTSIDAVKESHYWHR